MLQWMFFEQYEVEPAIAVVRFLIAIAGERDETRSARTQAGGGQSRARRDRRAPRRGREWLVGDRYTAADISISAYVQVAEDGEFDLSLYPNVQSWLARVAGVPGHVAMDD